VDSVADPDHFYTDSDPAFHFDTDSESTFPFYTDPRSDYLIRIWIRIYCFKEVKKLC
jgi:hypothetical protein